MADRSSVLHAPATVRSRFVPQQSDQDIFSVVKRRAEQASKYYNTVGLSNGDLPRDTTTSTRDRKRWTDSPDKKTDGVSASQVSAVSSQPSTPIVQSPNKYGAHWIKPSLSNSTSDAEESLSNETARTKHTMLPKEDTNLNDTFKNRISTPQTRSTTLAADHNTSSIYRQPVSLKPEEDLQVNKFTFPATTYYKNIEQKRSSVEYFNTVPRNADQTKKDTVTPVVKTDVFGPMSPPANGFGSNMLPVRVSSHLYTKQLSLNTEAPENKPSVDFKISYKLPQPKPRKDASSVTNATAKASKKVLQIPVISLEGQKTKQDRSMSMVSNIPSVKAAHVQRHRSNSDSQDDRRTQPMLFDDPDRVDGGSSSKMKATLQTRNSSSSLQEVSLRETNSLVQDRKKSKQSSHTVNSSPAAKYYKKNQHEATPKHSAGLSPKMQRRHNSKHKSKSDVADHRSLIDSLQNDTEGRYSFLQSDITSELCKKWRHNFAHYDWQSMLFSFSDVIDAMESSKRKNTPSGASKAAALAAAASTDGLTSKGSSTAGSQEDVSIYLGDDEGLEQNRYNNLVASCPFFRNEIGGEKDRVISVSGTSALSIQVGSGNDASSTKHAESVLTNHTYLSIVERESSRNLLPPHTPPNGSVSFGIGSVDYGATYYRSHFFDKDHQNFFGIDEKYGPVVISFRREKLEDKSDSGNSVYQYRIIVRTCELRTLRGSILEEVISPSRPPSSKGYPAKDILDYVCPEINLSCLKVAVATPKVNEQLMKVDEQNLQNTYKVGVLYCRAGQTTEEDMYNNENGSPALEQFLNLLGNKIKLNGFKDFRGGLDVKTDSTGTESVFTNFNAYQIMFHVSTLLPFTPNNSQQLLRKRHIGNDITTIVFQEPGSEPFNPKNIRSQFQHVFLVIRVHDPCSDNTCYSVAVARSRNIPRFGPPIPENSMFPISSTFREFILTKIINGENTAHTAGKFKSLAMHTREQYLRDMTLGGSTQTGVEENTKFSSKFKDSLISRRSKESKEKHKAKSITPALKSCGAITWDISVDDYCSSEAVPCILGISDCVLSIIEVATKQLIFSIPCQAVLGWTVPPPPSQENMAYFKRDLHIYYGRGERLSIHTDEANARDEIILRLARFTKGSETISRQLRRDAQGQLGFHVNYEGVVMEVEPNSCAAVDGLKQSSRLVEICKVAVATMTLEDILDLLRTSGRVTVVFIPPNEDGTPRKCSMELYHLSPVLDSKKVDLSSSPPPPTNLLHEYSRNVAFHNSQVESQSKARRASEEIFNNHVTHETQDVENNVHGKDDFRPTTRLKISKPLLTKTASGNDTKATLIATATRLALVGTTAAFRSHREKKENQSNASNILCSTKSTSTNLNSYSAADVDWTEDKADETLNSNSYVSSDSGMNSNNNSYPSTLSRGSSNTPTKSNNQQPACEEVNVRSSFLYSRNSNNSNNSYVAPLPYQSVQARNKKSRQDAIAKKVNWNTPKFSQSSLRNAKVDQSESSFGVKSSHKQSRSEPVPTTSKPKKQPVIASQSISEMTKKPFLGPQPYRRSSKNKRTVTDQPVTSSSLKSVSLDRDLRSNAPQSSQSKPGALQRSLLHLLASQSSTKPASSKSTSPYRKSPLRWASQRTSPQHRPIPAPRKTRPVYRTVSDESLCGAKADDVRLARQEKSESPLGGVLYNYAASGSVDSLTPSGGKYQPYGGSPVRIPSPIIKQHSFLLPESADWERLLDAAEVFEASGADDKGDVNFHLSSSLKRNERGQRIASLENLYDHEYRGNQGDPANLLNRDFLPPSNDPLTSSRIALASRPSDSEQRLDKIEKEMRLLQEKLQKEQDSKKKLEEEVSSLRRDNTLLLRHVQRNNPDLLNGFKRNKRKTQKP